MKKLLTRWARRGVLFSILMIALGAVLFVWPGHTLELATKLVGAGLLAAGVIAGIQWYRDRHVVGNSYINLATGILLEILGVIVLTAPGLIVSILPVCVGLMILVNGIVNLAQALDLRRAGYSLWTVSFIMAVLTLVLGALIALNPFSTMEVLVMAIGIILVYNGVTNLWIGSRYRKY